MEYHAEMLSSVVPGGSEIACLRAKTGLLHSSTVAELFTGVSQIYFAKEIAEMEIGKLVTILQNIHKKIIDSGLVVNLTSTETGIEMVKKSIAPYLEKFTVPKPPVFYSEEDFLAIVTPQNHTNEPEWFDAGSVVGFAACACKIDAPDEKMKVALNILLRWFSNTLLWEKIRTVGGAYGARAYLEDMDRLLVFYTYRDPNPEKSLEEFENCIKYAAEHTFTQEETEKALTGYYSLLISPKAPRSKGEIGFLRTICNKSREEKQQEMDILLKITNEDLKNAAEFLKSSCVNLQKTIIFNKTNKFAGKIRVLPL
jgi:Zn-dependent M16 (insulinase) family peptidase